MILSSASKNERVCFFVALTSFLPVTKTRTPEEENHQDVCHFISLSVFSDICCDGAAVGSFLSPGPQVNFGSPSLRQRLFKCTQETTSDPPGRSIVWGSSGMFVPSIGELLRPLTFRPPHHLLLLLRILTSYSSQICILKVDFTSRWSSSRCSGWRKAAVRVSLLNKLKALSFR